MIGPLRLRFDLRPTEKRCQLSPRRLALPSGLAPRILARGEARGEDYGFTVVVAHRWLGLVFAYRGSLAGADVLPDAVSEAGKL